MAKVKEGTFRRVLSTDDIDGKIKKYDDADVLTWLNPNATPKELAALKDKEPTEAEKKAQEEFKAAMDLAKKFFDKPEYKNMQSVEADFLALEKNDLKKAFRTSQGRGLAGVITSMGLDYNDAQWGTSQEDGTRLAGLRAPKTIGISVSFAPIHDMPLGLDHRGEMFAPSHPVGILSKNRIDAYKKADQEIDVLELKKEEGRATVSTLPDTSDPGDPVLPF